MYCVPGSRAYYFKFKSPRNTLFFISQKIYTKGAGEFKGRKLDPELTFPAFIEDTPLCILPPLLLLELFELPPLESPELKLLLFITNGGSYGPDNKNKMKKEKRTSEINFHQFYRIYCICNLSIV